MLKKVYELFNFKVCGAKYMTDTVKQKKPHKRHLTRFIDIFCILLEFIEKAS